MRYFRAIVLAITAVLTGLSFLPAMGAEWEPFEWQRFAVAYEEPPAHDDFDNALTIAERRFVDTVPISLATTAEDDPSIRCARQTGHNTVWYQITPSITGRLSVTTAGSDYDTILAIWTGERGNLHLRECDDNARRNAAEVSLRVREGQAYFIEIAADEESPRGTLNLRVALRRFDDD